MNIWLSLAMAFTSFYICAGLGMILALEMANKAREINLQWPYGRTKGYIGVILCWPYILYKLLTAKASESTMDES